MKIVLAGGGTGGHFYPLIAVAEALEDICAEKKLLEPELIYVGPSVFDPEALFEHRIRYRSTVAGRVRRYPSMWNLLDTFRTVIGVPHACRRPYPRNTRDYL